jgi:hypothetical protein
MDCPRIQPTFRMWDSFACFKLMKDESKSKVARSGREGVDLARAVVLLLISNQAGSRERA